MASGVSLYAFREMKPWAVFAVSEIPVRKIMRKKLKNNVAKK